MFCLFINSTKEFDRPKHIAQRLYSEIVAFPGHALLLAYLFTLPKSGSSRPSAQRLYSVIVPFPGQVQLFVCLFFLPKNGTYQNLLHCYTLRLLHFNHMDRSNL